MRKPSRVTLITTGRLDVVLHEPPPERTQHTIGRPRERASACPPWKRSYRIRKPVFQKLTLAWYGQGERTLEICSGTALVFGRLLVSWKCTKSSLG